jgi:hypothetical protein
LQTEGCIAQLPVLGIFDFDDVGWIVGGFGVNRFLARMWVLMLMPIHHIPVMPTTDNIGPEEAITFKPVQCLLGVEVIPG